MLEQFQERFGRCLPRRTIDFEFRSGLEDGVKARALVGQLVRWADSPQPERLVARLQVAVGRTEVQVGVGAVLLIFNAIQLAVFSRRREIEVMKLVGATNWFIRLPFMLEGMLQGVVGAAVAAILVYGFRSGIVNVISDPALTQGLRKISASPAEARNTGLVLMAVGAAIGATSSALAVRRHLKV